MKRGTTLITSLNCCYGLIPVRFYYGSSNLAVGGDGGPFLPATCLYASWRI